jgi:hypothetical protein
MDKGRRGGLAVCAGDADDRAAVQTLGEEVDVAGERDVVAAGGGDHRMGCRVVKRHAGADDERIEAGHVGDRAGTAASRHGMGERGRVVVEDDAVLALGERVTQHRHAAPGHPENPDAPAGHRALT